MKEAGTATISRLLRIVAGDAPISHGVELIAQDVVIHMDGHTFHGINAWAVWISYIRTRGRVTEPDVEVERMECHADGTITARGRWRARQQGMEVFSKGVWARYRVVDGVVAEIWTTRTNYAFLVGPMMNSFFGHLLVMLHLFFWIKNSGVPDLRTTPALAAGPTPQLTPIEDSVGA